MDRLVFDPSSGCLLWTGAVGSHGYGNFWTGERYVLAHRYAYEMAHGPIEGGRRGPVVMHSCDQPLCCSPRHLTLASHGANQADCREKDRGPQYRRRLSPEEEASVPLRHEAGESQQAIADDLGVNQTTISRILRGRPKKAVGA